MTEDLSHLTSELNNNEDDKSDALKHIATLAHACLRCEQEKAELENQLRDINEQIKKYKQESIPQTMLSVGLSSVQLDTGEKVSFKEDISCSVVDPEAFYDFLTERGDGALMKINLEIGKVPKEVLAKIVKTLVEMFEIVPTTKMGVHPQTLNKYIRELCGIDGKTVAEMSLESLDKGMIKTFIYYKTTIK